VLKILLKVKFGEIAINFDAFIDTLREFSSHLIKNAWKLFSSFLLILDVLNF
jgi:hypothetical protein